MVHTLRVLIAVVVTALAFAVTAAAPAAADESEYLRQLQPKYAFLNTQQLLDEGYKVCEAINGGITSADASNMVQKDLTVTVGRICRHCRHRRRRTRLLRQTPSRFSRWPR